MIINNDCEGSGLTCLQSRSCIPYKYYSCFYLLKAHVLRDSNRRTLETYSDDWFLLYTLEDIGEIKQIHIWLDYSGKSPSWYVHIN